MQIVITNIKLFTTFHLKRVSQQFINSLITNLDKDTDYVITVAEDENGLDTIDCSRNTIEIFNRG